MQITCLKNLRSLSLVEFLSSSEKGHNTRGFLSLLEKSIPHMKAYITEKKHSFIISEYYLHCVSITRLCVKK